MYSILWQTTRVYWACSDLFCTALQLVAWKKGMGRPTPAFVKDIIYTLDPPSSFCSFLENCSYNFLSLCPLPLVLPHLVLPFILQMIFRNSISYHWYFWSLFCRSERSGSKGGYQQLPRWNNTKYCTILVGYLINTVFISCAFTLKLVNTNFLMILYSPALPGRTPGEGRQL